MKKKDIREFISEICQIKKDMLKLNNEELKIYKLAFYMQDYEEYKLNIIWDYIWNYIPKQEMYRKLKLRWENGDNIQENKWIKAVWK